MLQYYSPESANQPVANKTIIILYGFILLSFLYFERPFSHFFRSLITFSFVSVILQVNTISPVINVQRTQSKYWKADHDIFNFFGLTECNRIAFLAVRQLVQGCFIFYVQMILQKYYQILHLSETKTLTCRIYRLSI